MEYKEGEHYWVVDGVKVPSPQIMAQLLDLHHRGVITKTTLRQIFQEACGVLNGRENGKILQEACGCRSYPMV